MRRILILCLILFCSGCSKLETDSSEKRGSNDILAKLVFKEGYNTNLGELHKVVNTFDAEVGDALKVAPSKLQPIILVFKESEQSGRYYYSVQTTVVSENDTVEKRNAFTHRGSISEGKTLQIACEASSAKVKDQIQDFEKSYFAKGYRNLQYPDAWKFEKSFKDSKGRNWCLVEQFFWFYVP